MRELVLEETHSRLPKVGVVEAVLGSVDQDLTADIPHPPVRHRQVHRRRFGRASWIGQEMLAGTHEGDQHRRPGAARRRARLVGRGWRSRGLAAHSERQAGDPSKHPDSAGQVAARPRRSVDRVDGHPDRLSGVPARWLAVRFHHGEPAPGGWAVDAVDADRVAEWCKGQGGDDQGDDCEAQHHAATVRGPGAAEPALLRTVTRTSRHGPRVTTKVWGLARLVGDDQSWRDSRWSSTYHTRSDPVGDKLERELERLRGENRRLRGKNQELRDRIVELEDEIERLKSQ